MPSFRSDLFKGLVVVLVSLGWRSSIALHSVWFRQLLEELPSATNPDMWVLVVDPSCGDNVGTRRNGSVSIVLHMSGVDGCNSIEGPTCKERERNKVSPCT